ncbi:arginine--tRNA ligase [Symbiobacterium thermophilum]|uniref:arginine--tRNA ligase domain-containing protein n=1 Tax=Symbiobacterium thermophilum TaxID=2734 RepID=UPI003081120C
MDYKQNITRCLVSLLGEHLSEQQINELLEIPRHPSYGDVAFPCFTLAKLLQKSPAAIAAELAENLHHPLFEKVEVKGAYVNFFLNKAAISKQIIETIMKQQHHYGDRPSGQGKTIILDFSSPNIAKSFSIGDLRSTVIGNAIANIDEKCGYRTIRINHLGDWEMNSWSRKGERGSKNSRMGTRKHISFGNDSAISR